MCKQCAEECGFENEQDFWDWGLLINEGIEGSENAERFGNEIITTIEHANGGVKSFIERFADTEKEKRLAMSVAYLTIRRLRGEPITTPPVSEDQRQRVRDCIEENEKSKEKVASLIREILGSFGIKLAEADTDLVAEVH